MGIKLQVDNPYDSISENGYIHIDVLILYYTSKKGELTLSLWDTQITRDTKGKNPIGRIDIPISSKDEQIQDNILININFDTIEKMNRSQIYSYLKTKYVNFNHQTLDLSSGIDII